MPSDVDRTRFIAARATLAEVAALKALAKHHNRRVSDMLRMLVRDAYEHLLLARARLHKRG